MKNTTKQWLEFAEIDLKTCIKLLDDVIFTPIVAFHSQQVVEKCFKAIIEEHCLQLPRVHSVAKLYGQIRTLINFKVDFVLIQKIDSVYTSSRYPSDQGLLPEGKPSRETALELYTFAQYIFDETIKLV